MIASIIKKFISGPYPGDDSNEPAAQGDPYEGVISRYPPFPEGIRDVPVERLIEQQSELIRAIQDNIGFTNEDFERYVSPVIYNYAKFVHLLPASESHHHMGTGGLFRHSLEVASWSGRAARGVIFSRNGSPRERRDNTPRWRLACCLAGLLHDAGKPLTDVRVTNLEGTLEWIAGATSLYDWLKKNESSSYLVEWRRNRHKRHEGFTTTMFERFVNEETKEYIYKAGLDIQYAINEALIGLDARGQIAKIVSKMDMESCERDMKRANISQEGIQRSFPTHKYVLDSIRHLLNSGVWTPNEPGSKVWVLEEGVFIVWKQAVGDIYEELRKNKVPGIQRDAYSLAESLLDVDVAIPYRAEGEEGDGAEFTYWTIAPKVLQRGEEVSVKLLALRIKDASYIFTETVPPTPVEGQVFHLIPDPDDPNNDTYLPGETEAEKPDKGGDEEGRSSAEDGSPIEGEEGQSEVDAQTQAHPGAALKLVPDQTGGGDRENRPDTAPGADQNEGREDEDDPLAMLLEMSEELEKGEPEKGEKTQGEAPLSVDAAAFKDETETSPLQEDLPVTDAEPFPEGKQSKRAKKTKSALCPDESFFDNATAREISPPAEEKIDIPGKSGSEHEEDEQPQNISDFLKKYGAAGKIIDEALQSVIEGRASLGESLILLGGNAAIHYPEGAKLLGEPAEVMGCLFDHGALSTDPSTPMRKVQDIKGVKALVLCNDISELLIETLTVLESEREDGGELKDLAPETKAPAEAWGIDSSGQGKKKKRKKSKRHQEENSLLTSSPNKPESDSSTSERISPVYKKNDKKAVHAPDTTREYVSEPEEEKDDARGDIYPTQITAEPRRKKAKRQNEEDGVSAQDAVRKLKQMITNGEGRWLTKGVRKANGKLFTGALCLEKIISEHPHLSKTKLRMAMRKEPDIYQAESNIYLEVTSGN